jgi:hypothetical protein
MPDILSDSPFAVKRPSPTPFPVHVLMRLLDGGGSIVRAREVEDRQQAVVNFTITLPLGSRSCQVPAGPADFAHYGRENQFR